LRRIILSGFEITFEAVSGWSKTMIDMQKDLQLYRSYHDRTQWKVPAFCCNDWAALRLLQICSELSSVLPFDIVYGAPRCSWAGGRPSAINQPLNEKELAKYLRAYRTLGVTCAFTLSKLHVPQEDYSDPYCNLILDLIEEYGGQAIVFDDGLAAYIRKAHPKVKTIASLNKAMCDYKQGFGNEVDEVDYYLRLLELYDEVVIRCEFASEDKNLESLSDVNDHIEIIVNQFCAPDCKNVYKHLKAIEDWNDNGQIGQCQQCFSLGTLLDMGTRLKANLFMSVTRIEELAGKGFVRMKLAGRNAILPKFVDMLSRYIFEPTGAIAVISNEVLREYRIQSSRYYPAIQQYHIPDLAAINYANRTEASRWRQV
jgi:hypothetical protein